MTVSNELAKPDSDDDFEAMCHSLYHLMWKDISCSRVGGSMCKHYNKKPFTLSTVTDDIALSLTESSIIHTFLCWEGKAID